MDYDYVQVPRELLEEWYDDLRAIGSGFSGWPGLVAANIYGKIEELIPEYTEGEVAP